MSDERRDVTDAAREERDCDCVEDIVLKLYQKVLGSRFGSGIRSESQVVQVECDSA